MTSKAQSRHRPGFVFPAHLCYNQVSSIAESEGATVAPVTVHPSDPSVTALTRFNNSVLYSTYNKNVIRQGRALGSRGDSSITVRAYDTYEPLVGLIQDSRKLRHVEIDAELRSRFGDAIEATDTIGRYKAAGMKRCARCGQYKLPEAFSRYKRQGRDVVYLHSYCKRCRNDMDKTKRFSMVEPVNPYPKRAGSD